MMTQWAFYTARGRLRAPHLPGGQYGCAPCPRPVAAACARSHGCRRLPVLSAAGKNYARHSGQGKGTFRAAFRKAVPPAARRGDGYFVAGGSFGYYASNKSAFRVKNIQDMGNIAARGRGRFGRLPQRGQGLFPRKCCTRRLAAETKKQASPAAGDACADFSRQTALLRGSARPYRGG